MPNTKPSVKKNFIYSSIFRVLILIIPFITTPYVSRVLGAENIGKYSYASAMATYFTLFAALGSSTYGQRIIAYHRDDITQRSDSFWNTFIFRLIMSTISLLLYIAYIVFFEGVNRINAVIGIGIINVALDISWYFQGIEDFKNVVIRTLIVRITCLFGVFAFVKSSYDTWIYVLIIEFAQLAGSLSMWRMMRREVFRPNKIHPFYGFREIWSIFLPTIAIQVYTILDKSMIGWITGSGYANGCYEQSERIARLALTIVTSIGTVVLPRVANLYHKDNTEEAKRYVYLAFRVVWMLAIPIMFGLMIVSSVFIPVFLGPGFDDAVGLLIIFSTLVPVVSLAYVTGLSYLVPTKQQYVYTAAVSIAAAFNFIVNLLLIPQIGAYGAAIASVLAECVGVVIQIGYCSRKGQLNLKKIFYPCWKYLFSGTIMYAVLSLIKTHYSSGIDSLMILVFSGILIYVIILIVLKDQLLLDNIKRLPYIKNIKLQK